MGKEKNIFIFWILFLFLNFIGWHAFYVKRMKEFWIRIVIATCVYIVIAAEFIFAITTDKLHIQRSDYKFMLFDFVYDIGPSFKVFFVTPTIFTVLGFVLAVWAAVDFFRIVTKKYIPKDFLTE